jgi:AraC family transcriptional activator of pobA
MARKKEKIAEFDISPEATSGVSVIEMQAGFPEKEHDVFTPHRDTHYLLAIATKGDFSMMIDFEEVQATAPAILLISPGQVHQLREINDPHGISINFDPSLLSSGLQMVLLKDPALVQQVHALAQVILQLNSDISQRHVKQATQQILLAIVHLIANATDTPAKKENRALVIEQEFQVLLQRHFKEWKKPSQYAAALTISLPHLNDTVRSITGHSISTHIQQQVILEAKRLLYFSELSMKEISFAVGIEDPVYFSKLFRKLVDMTPIQFRQRFR